jgi:hypothetical protein
MNIYSVTVLAEAEDGTRVVVGSGLYEAEDVLAAHELARDDHWDERLTGHCLCTFRSEKIDDPCRFCSENTANGECGVCGEEICMDCHIQDRCCNG